LALESGLGGFERFYRRQETAGKRIDLSCQQRHHDCASGFWVRGEQMFRRFSSRLVLLLASTLTAQKKATVAPQEFAGTYGELSPAQKKLIDEWYAEYNQLTHDSSRPIEYNQFSQSTRTTFEAVTHALMTTRLTDKSGNFWEMR